MNETLHSHHDAPKEHEKRQPNGGAQALEKDIGGDFKYGVGKKEYGEGDAVLCIIDMKVRLQIVELK